MKKLFSLIALLFVFSSSHAQMNSLSVMNYTGKALTVTVVAGDPTTCNPIQTAVVTLPTGMTTTIPPLMPGMSSIQWLAVCNNSSGTCDTYHNTLVPNTCLGTMPGNPIPTIFTGTWLNTFTLQLTP